MFKTLAAIIRYLLHVDSFLVISVLAFLFGILSWAGTLPGVLSPAGPILSKLIWFSYFFLVARRASIGSRRLPVPWQYQDSWDSLIFPLAQLFIATGWYWAVVMGVIQKSVGLGHFIERYDARFLAFLGSQGSLGYFLLGTGLLFIPPAIVAVLVTRDVRMLLNPFFGFSRIGVVRSAYLSVFMLFIFLFMIGFLVDAFTIYIESAMPIPLAAPVLGNFLRLWVPLAESRLLGGFVFEHRTKL